MAAGHPTRQQITGYPSPERATGKYLKERPPMSQVALNVDSLTSIRKVGHITPSSNTSLEIVTALMNSAIADRCSHHFTRLPVTAVKLDAATEHQFEIDTMVAAARLLADAPLDAIVWNGTSSSWLGIGRDEELCRRISDSTGLKASTSTLALHEAFRLMKASRIALAVPYVDDLTERIAQTYHRHGFEVVSRAFTGQYINREIGNNSMNQIRELLRAADSPDADCIAVVCTNYPATLLIDEMEHEIGKPIIDSIAVTFWKGCRLAGIDPTMPRWGSLLRGDLAAK
jgi:maleate isomerase